MVTGQPFTWERAGRVLFFLAGATWSFSVAFIKNDIYYPSCLALLRDYQEFCRRGQKQSSAACAGMLEVGNGANRHRPVG
jgi:hypothetical protein